MKKNHLLLFGITKTNKKIRLTPLGGKGEIMGTAGGDENHWKTLPSVVGIGKAGVLLGPFRWFETLNY